MIVADIPVATSAWKRLLGPISLMLAWDVAVTWAYLEGWLGSRAFETVLPVFPGLTRWSA